MINLQDTKIFKELEGRKDERSRYYASFLRPLAHDMGPFLENIKCLFPEYPDHGIQHSLRIIEYIGEIISPQIYKTLSSLDIVVFIFSALLHDSGMALFNVNDTEKAEIRKAHPAKAKEVINRYFDDYVRNMNETERIKRAVIFVCEAHGFTLDELIKHEFFKMVDRVDTLNIHYGILAFLLRIGDLMDLEVGRVNKFRMLMFCDGFNEISKEHNLRHMKVLLYNYNSNVLQIKVAAETDLQYKIWSEWLSWLKDNIEKFNAIFACDGLFLPNPEIEIKNLSEK